MIFFSNGSDNDSVNKYMTQKHTEKITPQTFNRNLDVILVCFRYSLNVIMIISYYNYKNSKNI